MLIINIPLFGTDSIFKTLFNTIQHRTAENKFRDIQKIFSNPFLHGHHASFLKRRDPSPGGRVKHRLGCIAGKIRGQLIRVLLF